MTISYFLFVCLPILEVLLFLLVVSTAGLGTALFITLLFSVLGLALIRQPFRSEKLFSGDAVDYLLHRLAGPLFFIPGFLTDVIAALLLIPLGRRLFRRVFRRYLARWETTAASAQSPWGFMFPFVFGSGQSANTAESGYSYDYPPDEEAADPGLGAAIIPPEPILPDPNPETESPEEEIIDVEFEAKSP